MADPTVSISLVVPSAPGTYPSIPAAVVVTAAPPPPPPPPPPPAASGLLTGVGTSAATTANLTAEGTADWVHFGDAALTRKAAVTAELSTYAMVGGGTAAIYTNDPRPLSWTDGTPTASATSDVKGLFVAGIGKGFSLIAPADTTLRTMVVHCGGWNSGATLTAHLSDGSAADFVDVVASSSAQYDRNYTITYRAAAAGQTLTVSWVQSSSAGNVTLNAAALAVSTVLVSTVAPVAGTPQSATVSTVFATAMSAKVLDGNGNPVVGAVVTFAAPSTGASGLFGSSATATATTDATGTATAPAFTANGIAGAFAVTASTPSVVGSASFALTSTAVAGTQAPGTWLNTTPAGILLDPTLFSNGNFGVVAVAAHPQRPSDIYFSVCNQGIWKSTDFGKTVFGPINTGTNGSVITAGAGSLKIALSGPSNPPIIYSNNLRGPVLGLFKSVDGGVNWTACAALPTSQDIGPMVIDPYDASHVLVPYHEQDLLAETTDGGLTWRNVPLAAGMLSAPGTAGTAGVWFVDTGGATGTRTTWLWCAQSTGGSVGIWRTPDSGTTWTQVQTFEKAHGGAEPAQLGGGIIIFGGPYGSGAGFPATKDKNTWGTFYSTDYGQTWTLNNSSQNGVYLVTPSNVYSMYEYAAGATTVNPNPRTAPQPGLVWSPWGTAPSWMLDGWAEAVAVFDGTNWILIGAFWNSGIGRYIEPVPAGGGAVVTPPVVTPPSATTTGSATPQLTVTGNALTDPHGNKVILRGVSSQGMGMVYGDKDNPGTYLPMTIPQYVQRSVGVDGQGQQWYARVIRLVFERYPCADPTRLYAVENMPYAMPDTQPFLPWLANTPGYVAGNIVTAGGKRFRTKPCQWRADKGQGWNPGAYQVGDVRSGWNNAPSHVYHCDSVPATPLPIVASPSWGGGPTQTSGTSVDIFGNTWSYIGEVGMSGSVPLDQLTPVNEYDDSGPRQYWIDGLTAWTFDSPDYTPAEAAANFADWVSKVLEPAINAAKASVGYVIVTDFDFGPAHHPLRKARMEALWGYMATSPWANDPQVLFELWNESEDLGGISGSAGSWASQKPVIQGVVDLIRATANNLIIVPPPFFSAWIGEATASPLTGEGIIYAWHQYRSQFEDFSSNRDQLAQAQASGLPIFVTEWGDDRNPTDPAMTWWDTSSVTPFKVLVEPSEGSLHPVCGWTAWDESQSWFPGFYNDTALMQPNAYGQAVRNALASMKDDSQPVA